MLPARVPGFAVASPHSTFAAGFSPRSPTRPPRAAAMPDPSIYMPVAVPESFSYPSQGAPHLAQSRCGPLSPWSTDEIGLMWEDIKKLKGGYEINEMFAQEMRDEIKRLGHAMLKLEVGRGVNEQLNHDIVFLKSQVLHNGNSVKELKQQVDFDIGRIMQQVGVVINQVKDELRQQVNYDMTQMKQQLAGGSKLQQIEYQIAELDSIVKQQFAGQIENLSVKVRALDSLPPQIQSLNMRIDDVSVAIAEHSHRIGRLELLTSKQESEIEGKVREIESRGNVTLDLATGQMKVLKEIAFLSVKASDEPVAKLKDPSGAAKIIDDIFAFAGLFSNEIVTVEGHTGGGVNDFWQRLADDRARLVGQELITRGQAAATVITKGYPGKKGLNKSEVSVKLAMQH